MNVVSRKLLCTSAFVLAAVAGPASAATVDCTRPPNFPEALACQAAARGGVTELRQFIIRTRAVYNLFILDFDSAVRP